MAATFGALCVHAAEEPRIRFQIQPKSYAEALIDLALQGDVSLLGAATCGAGDSPGLNGAFSVDQALARVLAGAPCSWRLRASRSVEIMPLVLPVSRDHVALTPTPVAEVLVTATKRVQSAERLAVAVSVIPGRQIQLTGAVDPGDTIGQVAGVLATDLGPGRDKLLLRGLSDGAFTGRSRSTVGTYLDDTPINYNAPDPDLRLVDVERVEIIRGPQGALYGGGSLSGIYRIVTRKPDLERWSASARASTSSTEGGAPSRAVDGYINMPLGGIAGVRLSAYDEKQGGYLDDVNIHLSNVDRTRREGGRLALSLQPGGAWTVDIAGALQRLRSDDTHYTTPGMGLERANKVAEPHANDIGLVTATVRGAWGWGELVSSTALVRHTYSSTYDAGAAKDLFTLTNPDQIIYSDETHTRMLVQDLVLTSRGAGRFGWLAGLYASTTSEMSPSSIKARLTARAPFSIIYRDARHDRRREVAIYGEGSYALAPEWTVALGARVFNIHTRTTSDVISERFAPRTLDRSANFAGISPKISLEHRFMSGDLVYAVISEGYRPGGINSGGSRPLSTARETFGPDRLQNYEIGAKARALDDRLSLRSAVFYDLWRNIQTDQFRPSGIPYTANVGDARILGIETEIGYAWDMGLALQANALISRTRVGHANPDYAAQLTHGLPGAPDLSGGVLALYQRPLAAGLSLRLMGEANYVGHSRVTFDPALASEMGGYVRARLSAGVAASHWTAELFVTNPANALSNTFAYGNPFSFGLTRQITPQRPRTFGLEISGAL